MPGDLNHFHVTGTATPFNLDKKGFDIKIMSEDRELTVDEAVKRNWHITYIAHGRVC